MVSSKEEEKFKSRLHDRREEIFRLRNEMDRSKQELVRPEIEEEETAAKSKMSYDLEILDEREVSEIRAIDRALAKIEAGTYGYCESCGNVIPEKRLDALPWAAHCIECSKNKGEEGGLPNQESLSETPVPEDFTGLLDDELADAVYEKLRYDGRISMEEIRIYAEGEKLFLEGHVPSNMEKQILLDILENRMGLRNVVEHVAPNPLLWQNKNRTDGIKKYQEEENAPFSRPGKDSGETGISEKPPENFIPER